MIPRLGIAVLLAAFALIGFIPPAPAAAHPLGNFTVNRYARLEVGADSARVRYALDLAEIPTFQAMPQLDANRDGTVSAAEGRAYAERRLDEAAQGVHLSVDGRRLPLRGAGPELELTPGQANLSTTRITGWLEPATPVLISDGARVTLRDENEPARIGWREIVVRAEALSLSGTVPVTEVSDELRAYPENMLMGPLDVRQVSFDVTSAAASAGPAGTPHAQSAARTGASLERATEHVAALVTATTLTPAVVLGALLTAMLFGAGHALSPGHGKTIVGAYLVGARGTARHALFLGLTVTVVHTAGVFALLLVTLFASRYVLPEAFFPWMSLASGLLVVAIGLGLVRSRLRHARGENHHHGRLDGELTHDHGMGAHTHSIPGIDGQPVTLRSLLVLGISGGLLPCPSALVLGLASIAIGRALYGLVLITAFSAGLAATLVAIGLLMVYSGRAAGRLRLAERLAERVTGRRGSALLNGTKLLPLGSALVVSLAGCALTAEALRQIDLPALWATSAPFRTHAALLLSLGLAAAASVVALRTGPSRSAVAHTHAHAHAHAHAHEPGNASAHSH